jgi:hypothetical protein
LKSQGLVFIERLAGSLKRTNQEPAQSHGHALNLTNLLTADGKPMVELSGITPLILLLPITSCAASSKVRAGGLEIPCPGRFDGGLAADGHPKLEVLGSVNFED